MNTGDQVIFGEPYFDDAERDAVIKVLDSRWIGQGPVVQAFERALGSYVDASEVVSTASCTGALHLCLRALGIGPGDEVISTPFTFVATINAIEHTGATPVLVDIDRATLSVDPNAVAGAITGRTKAIMPVSFGGRPLDLPRFAELADRHDVWLIEDAAHSMGAVAAGHRVGHPVSERSLTCFSFYPNKNLATAEGGAITLTDAGLAERLRQLRLHGLNSDAWNRYRDDAARFSLAVEAGFKENWTDLQAAIALAQLDKLEGFLATREHLAVRYDEALADVPGVRVLQRSPQSLRWRHALHLYQVEIDGPPGRRDAVLARLRSNGVGAAVHYIAVHEHPYYQNRFGGRFPNASWASGSLLTLPLTMHLTDPQVTRVVQRLKDALTATR